MSAVSLYMLKGKYISTNDFKYPARLYYFSYAIPMTIVCIEFIKKIRLKSNLLINFISSSSLWIYLWHILVLYVVKSIIVNDKLWILQYLAVLIISIIIAYIQNIVIKFLIDKYKMTFLKVFLG